MILKQKDKQKHMEKAKKEHDKHMKDQCHAFNDKLEKAKQMKKNEQMQFKEKCNEVIEKHRNIDTKIKEREQRIDIFTKKHKQLTELRFQDFAENKEVLQDQNFLRNCKIDEKHLALTLMNQDRKMFMQNHNDKFRAKLNKERFDFKS